jgi:hypothetical protein
MLAMTMAACTSRSGSDAKPLSTLETPARQAVARAEAFVRDQGYTDAEAGADTPIRLGPWDCLTFGGSDGSCHTLDRPALIANRQGTLLGDAEAVERTGAGWLVYFRVDARPRKNAPYLCAAVPENGYPTLFETECRLTDTAIRIARTD